MKALNQAEEHITNMKYTSEPVKAAEVGNNTIKDLTEKDLAGISSKNGRGRLKRIEAKGKKNVLEDVTKGGHKK